ncbi:MAG TPA: tagaturonate epimerase family protein [Armatimonadota bacterium]|nr:tagaturonate epimerase family protein [Armatimonadota bacterium]
MLSSLLKTGQLAPPLGDADSKQLATQLAQAAGWHPYPQSITALRGALFFLARRDTDKRLCLLWQQDAKPDLASDFCGEPLSAEIDGIKLTGQAGCLDHTNALGLRKHLPFLQPRVIGVRPSFGSGDRLGIATPAHVRAVSATGIAPFFAQQSIREMTRTGRTPDQVMDTAVFGVFQEGYRDGFGADADHLKNADDIDATLAAGFTMFTIDPGDHVDNEAETDDIVTLRKKFEALPWPQLETAMADQRARYVDKSVRLPDGSTVTLDEEALFRAAVKYGRALAHTAAMYRHLKTKAGDRPFELEMSVDETATPTSVAEHVFVAGELQRLGVEWVSLAPRFIGEFEKGVDYIGDLAAFEKSFAGHVAVAQHFGPYKISIHSGSDKFSIYPIAARLAGDLVHLKTAGTSYLEALRAIATIDTALFREIMGFAIERYPEDRASYHVSADLAKVPAPQDLADGDLPAILDQFDTRETLHVTFGSVLTAAADGRPRFRDRFMQALAEHEDVHYEIVRRHIARHLTPFVEARR